MVISVFQKQTYLSMSKPQKTNYKLNTLNWQFTDLIKFWKSNKVSEDNIRDLPVYSKQFLWRCLAKQPT